MQTTKKIFTGLEYPGRFIIGGQIKDSDDVFVVYGLTGRSTASQARQMIKRDNGIWVEPTDPQLIARGNPDLLIYPAILFSPRGVAASNGQQTLDIIGSLEATQEPVLALTHALKDWKYEPDEPIYTPRISLAFSGGFNLGMSLIKRGEFGQVIREYFELPLVPGKGWLLMTYMGVNIDPVPSYFGEPASLEISESRVDELVSSIYESLEPAPGKKDLRVAVACLIASATGLEIQQIKIINRKET
ncbi:MAG: IMP cyclohydrolase [Acidobacteriota bacterium]|nr:IMP cyclohydrolase [Acidobacteriota bacterium]